MRYVNYLALLTAIFIYAGCSSSPKRMITNRMVAEQVKIERDSSFIECHNSSSFYWAANTGGSMTEAGCGVCADMAGNVYAVGSFQGVAALDKDYQLKSRGQDDMFLAKFSNEGRVIWAFNVGDSSSEAGTAICSDNKNNVIVTGYYSGWETFAKNDETTSGVSNVFIKKYDSTGKFIWVRHAAGGGTKAGSGICTDADGAIYVTGYFEGSISFGSGYSFGSRGGSDIFVAKYSDNGGLLWAKHAGGSDLDGGRSVCIDDEGNVYVTGFFEGKARFGKTKIESSGYCDIFIAKYSKDGELIWVRTGGSSDSDDYGYGIAADKSANIYVTGMCSGASEFDSLKLRNTGNFDVFLIKYNPEGEIQWAKQAGGKLADAGYGINISQKGDLYLTGYFKDIAKFDTLSIGSEGKTDDDVFIAKYTQDGNIIWLKQAGGAQRDYGFSISSDIAGNVLFSGYFAGKPGFGDISLATSDRSIFVSKIIDLDSCVTKMLTVKESRVDSVMKSDTVFIDD